METETEALLDAIQELKELAREILSIGGIDEVDI